MNSLKSKLVSIIFYIILILAKSCNLDSQTIHNYRKYYDEHFHSGEASSLAQLSIPTLSLKASGIGGNVVVIDDFDRVEFVDGFFTVVSIDGKILIKSLSVKQWNIEDGGQIIGVLQPKETISLTVAKGQLLTFRNSEGDVRLVQVASD